MKVTFNKIKAYIGIIMIVVILIAMASMLVRCRPSNLKIKDTGYVIEKGYGSLKQVNIDGCEYLYGDWGKAIVLTHKGNCINHRSK
jgi:hypothetical protein